MENANIIHEEVAIIDRSASMMGKEDDTIGGINSTFEVLRNNKDINTNIKVSIKFFDHEEKMLIKSLNIDKLYKPNLVQTKNVGHSLPSCFMRFL